MLELLFLIFVLSLIFGGPRRRIHRRPPTDFPPMSGPFYGGSMHRRPPMGSFRRPPMGRFGGFGSFGGGFGGIGHSGGSFGRSGGSRGSSAGRRF